MQPITNPAVPFVGPVRLNQGEIVRIQGFVPATADRFNINLHCGPPPSDIALHLSIRLLQNYIARNSLEIGAWGNEEGDGGLPIGVDQGFEVLILCDRQNYKIAINGNHYCEFNHRVPFQQVSHLAIDGDVALKLISYENGPSAPPPMGGSDYGPPPMHYGNQRPHSGEGATRPPGYKEEEESGFDNFLETAGTVLVGALASGVASNLISNFTGSGGQSQNQQQHPQQQYYQPPPPPPQPQQPLFQLGGLGGLGGDGSMGGLGSVGSALLTSLAGELLKPHPNKGSVQVSKSTIPLHNRPPPFNMPIPSSAPLPPYGMPMPTNVSLPPANMPMPSSNVHAPTGPPNYHMSTQPVGVYPVQTYGSPYVNNVPSYVQNVPPYGQNVPPYGQNVPPYGNTVPPPYPMNANVPYNKKKDKKMKKKLKKAAKYGVPIAAAGVGAYAVSRALHRSSSSSSSSSSD